MSVSFVRFESNSERCRNNLEIPKYDISCTQDHTTGVALFCNADTQTDEQMDRLTDALRNCFCERAGKKNVLTKRARRALHCT